MLKATDNTSGVKNVEVRRAKVQILLAKFKTKLAIKGSTKNVSVRVIDGAGNPSAWKKVQILAAKLAKHR